MRKCIYYAGFIFLFIFISILNANSQGWVGNGGNNLSAVNSSLSSTPINIGIGTNAPGAQLHTTGTLRFANLLQNTLNSRVLVTDATGNVTWRDASTIGTTNAWLLTGNTGTTTANFLGTLDNQNLSFRTNNLQRMTILGNNGFVGIGVPNPQVNFHVSNSLGVMPYLFETAVIERGNDAKLGVYCSNANPVGGTQGAALALGFTNYTNAQGLFPGFEMQYLINNNTTSALRFNAIQRDNTGNVTQATTNALVINDNGDVGINLGPANFGFPTLPTADFHTLGTVRHQNLPLGTGNVVVIDANGNLFRSNQTARISSSDEIIKLQEEITALKKEIQAIKQSLIRNKDRETNIQNGSITLFQNAPNPFNAQTIIRYSIEGEYKNAKIIITSLTGNLLKEFQVGNEYQYVKINGNELSAGTYIYTLYVDNKMIDSKRMILTH